MKNALVYFVLFLALTGCSRKEDPAPASGAVTIMLSNNTLLMTMPTSACLRETPMRKPGTGQVLWAGRVTNTQVAVGQVARGTRLYLSIQYDDVSSFNYWWPTKDEAMQAELLVDGKWVRSVSLNADSATDPANFFLPDGPRTHLVQEVEVVL